MIRNSTETVMRPVSTSTFQKIEGVRRRLASARARAPNAPTAPASVAVKMPP